MKKTKLILIGLLFYCLGYNQTTTLELNPAAGDYFTNNELSLSWSIGEGIIETFSNNEITLTQGFQQPSLKITLIEESDEADFQINVFPNPAKDYFTINLTSKENINCSAQLFDISGRLLLSKPLIGTDITETIDLSKYTSGLYILKITGTKGEFAQSYKIQKTK